jgi:RNA polymerase sigma-70 factor (ECF subfamily)
VQVVTDERLQADRTVDENESAPNDPDRFGDWASPHLPAMARLAARLGPAAERDDIVQEALARAWSKRKQFDRRRGTPSAWLLAITADQARKALRRFRPVDELRDRASPAVQSDDRLDVEAAIRRLPARQRLAVDCYYMAGLSVAETAAVMGCAEGTVKSTLSDARLRLRNLIEDV